MGWIGETVAAVLAFLVTPLRALFRWVRRKRLGGVKGVRIIPDPHGTIVSTDRGETAVTLDAEFLVTNVNPFPIRFVRVDLKGANGSGWGLPPYDAGLPNLSEFGRTGMLVSGDMPRRMHCTFDFPLNVESAKSRGWRLDARLVFQDQFTRKYRAPKVSFVLNPVAPRSE